MAVKIKICGITSLDALREAIRLKVDFVGMVFYNLSPRNVSIPHAEELAAIIPSNIKKVAVVANPDQKLLKEIFTHFKPHYLQFDSNESPEHIKAVKNSYKCKIIKTIYLESEKDLETAYYYQDCADLLLLEAKYQNPFFIELPDYTFDWEIANKLESNVPWILSGGLNKHNFTHALRITGAKIINVSSTLESSPGHKDPKLINEFVQKVRHLNKVL